MEIERLGLVNGFLFFLQKKTKNRSPKRTLPRQSKKTTFKWSYHLKKAGYIIDTDQLNEETKGLK